MNRQGRLRDRTSGRISAVGVVALALLALLVAFGTLIGVNQDVDAPAAPEKTTARAIGSSDSSDAGDSWNIDYSASYIRFSGIESGATFEGEWKQWSAMIQFDAAALDASFFDVRIVATEVETGNDDRDEALQLSTWFDTDNYPEIVYEARQFAKREENAFVANGFLTIREKRTLVPLEFTASEESDSLVLNGETVLDRIALEVGTSEFADTRWINQFVNVVVHVETID